MCKYADRGDNRSTAGQQKYKKKKKYSYTKGRMLPCKRMSLHEHTHAISYIHTPAHAFISEHMVESHIFKKEGISRLLLKQIQPIWEKFAY